jgi:hypothetical protein
MNEITLRLNRRSSGIYDIVLKGPNLRLFRGPIRLFTRGGGKLNLQ